MKDLIDKYGEEFNWGEVDANATIFEKEAYKEICSAHPLHGIKLKAIARCYSCDDVLFKGENGEYIIVHLTYSQINSKDYPRFITFPAKSAAMEHIEKEYLLEHGCTTCWCIELKDSIDSPQEYDKCLEYIKHLLDSSDYELIDGSCKIEEVRNTNGAWNNDVIFHKIKCKECGRTFICSANTYRGGGSFTVEDE